MWHTKIYLTQKEVGKEAQRNKNRKRHIKQMANVNPTMSPLNVNGLNRPMKRQSL